MSNPTILTRTAQCPECKQASLYIIQHEGKITKRCQLCTYADPPLFRPWWRRLRVCVDSGFGLAIIPSITFYAWRGRLNRYTDWDITFQFWRFAIIVGLKAD